MPASQSPVPSLPTLATVRAHAQHPDTVQRQADVLIARAYAEVTREHVDAYEVAAFASWNFTDDWDTGERIEHPRDLDLSDDDALCAKWYAHCDELHAANGYTVEPGYWRSDSQVVVGIHKRRGAPIKLVWAACGLGQFTGLRLDPDEATVLADLLWSLGNTPAAELILAQVAVLANAQTPAHPMT